MLVNGQRRSIGRHTAGADPAAGGSRRASRDAQDGGPGRSPGEASSTSSSEERQWKSELEPQPGGSSGAAVAAGSNGNRVHAEGKAQNAGAKEGRSELEPVATVDGWHSVVSSRYGSAWASAGLGFRVMGLHCVKPCVTVLRCAGIHIGAHVPSATCTAFASSCAECSPCGCIIKQAIVP